MRKNIKGIAAGSLGLLALQLPGMTVFAQAADRKARLANALQNTVLGMGTVFVMLIAIALIIYCFKIIPVIQKKFLHDTKNTGRYNICIIRCLSESVKSDAPVHPFELLISTHYIAPDLYLQPVRPFYKKLIDRIH